MISGKVRFDQALETALDFCRRHRGQLGGDTVVVRDVVGYIRIATPERVDQPESFWQELHEALGAWSPGIQGLTLVGNELLSPESIFNSPEASPIADGLRFLDRRISERDWVPRSNLPSTNSLPTIAFFGVKGGVGRSTALSVTARRLAEKGHRVMVIDLDLESPGVSSLLLSEEAHPRYGVVDWLVESGVGQADTELLLSMMATSPLASGTRGEIQVIPAAGEAVETYVAKLARVQTSSDSPSGYAASLAGLLNAIASLDRPPAVVLLDCRAGIDDLAAVAITGLASEALLFAAGSPQTWLAYRMLFSVWNKDPKVLAGFRDKLQIIAGLVPETGRDLYLERLRNNAYDLFAGFLYDDEPDLDEQQPSSAFDLFNFDPNNDQAPHYAVPVFWRRDFQEYDPIHHPESETPDALAAFDNLVRYVEGCLDSRGEESP